MEITSKNRSQLKAYFVKNAIPTESNFADLIEGMINSKEDGMVKLPDNPLSIEVGRDNGNAKPAIHFYNDFANPSPDWIISLDPHSGTSETKITVPGFNISDDSGNSRLFIDKLTGNLGIGTVNPKTKLDVAGGITSSNLTIGPWPANLNYVFFGVNTLDQENYGGNYALLQGVVGKEKGRTFLNSPVDIRFRINNSDRMTLSSSGLEVNSLLFGAVKGPDGESLRIASGRTGPSNTNWIQYGDNGIYVDIDTSLASFTSVPIYITSLGGNGSHWMTEGVTSIYSPTKNQFRIYLYRTGLTVKIASDNKWFVNWIGIGS